MAGLRVMGAASHEEVKQRYTGAGAGKLAARALLARMLENGGVG